MDYLICKCCGKPKKKVVGKLDAPASSWGRGVTMGGGKAPKDVPITAPATPLAQTWAGHRYGSQALRNLIEAILIFRKPYEGKPYECIVETGAGALNIEGSRIGTTVEDVNARKNKEGPGNDTKSGLYGSGYKHVIKGWGNNSGRHPANFLLQHSDRCIPRGTKRVRGDKREGGQGSRPGGFGDIGAEKGTREPVGKLYGDADGLETVADFSCVPECPVRLLDEQAGELKSGTLKGEYKGSRGDGIFGEYGYSEKNYESSTGGPSRFVHCADWRFEQTRERIEAANAVRYQAKPSRAERDAGLDGFELKRITRLDGGEFEHNSVTRTASKNGSYAHNSHPTVKPIALMKYLAGLLLPPDAYAPRRILIPFAGSGSECIGAALAGWEEVVGVELEAEYVAIARARIAWWQNAMRYGQTDPAVILANAPPEANERGDVQLDLFAPDNGKVDAL